MKTILVTGSTDGIGLATAKALLARGHRVLIHGRNQVKVDEVVAELAKLARAARVSGHVADLSDMASIESLARNLLAEYPRLDVLINNAGVYRVPETVTSQGWDMRFAVNTLAPYRLTQLLMPLMTGEGRVINLASAAQAPVDMEALAGETHLSDDFSAYAQSKLALIMWTRHLARKRDAQSPLLIAVNPGSLLASKMVKEGFGVPGKDINIGADILLRVALDDEFAKANGEYFDNDSGRFASPHAHALDDEHCHEVVAVMERFPRESA